MLSESCKDVFPWISHLVAVFMIFIIYLQIASYKILVHSFSYSITVISYAHMLQCPRDIALASVSICVAWDGMAE